ncbi:MAG: hypothetical protein DMG50_27850 [Acidobacteria bacterium]|nr:MAG: hypothetical protein DMG50_27850 [Acidobacteriota bacterium]
MRNRTGHFDEYATYQALAKNRDKVALVNPLDELFKWLPEADFAVLEHRFAKHGRDYILLVEDSLGSNPGQHEIVFTQCVKAECETRVRDEVWLKSWSDEFTDTERWTSAGEPDGYVWGTNWSVAYPGFRAVLDSAHAAEWSRRLGKQMFETTLETDRFFLRLVFHSIRSRKTSEKHETISQVTHRL